MKMKVNEVTMKGIIINLPYYLVSFGIAAFGFVSNFDLVTDVARWGIIVGLITTTLLLIKERKLITLGEKKIYIPLLVIGISMIGSNIVNANSDLLAASILAVIAYFEIYLAARIWNHQITRIFPYIVIIESLSVIAFSLFINYGQRNGGIASLGDYNIATGILVFGAIIAVNKNQWIVVTIAAIGLLFTGAEEGIVGIFVIFVAVLVQRDWGKRLLLPVAALAILTILGLYPFDYIKMLYAVPIDKLSVVLFQHHSNLVSQYPVLNPDGFTLPGDYALDGRVTLLADGLKHISILGNGFKVYPAVDLSIDHQVHNVPLIIVQQVGPVAACAWIFVSFYSFIKSKWLYPFAALFALCLFDFYMWCKIGSWWWLLIGLSSVVTVKRDLIFRRNKT